MPGCAAGALVVAHIAVDLTLLLTIVTLNAVIVGSVMCVRVRTGSGPSVAARLVVNLCVADTYVAVATAYYVLCACVGASWCACACACVLRFFLIAGAHLASACAMAAVAVDRYCAVVHALRYCAVLTSRRANLLMLGGWLIAFTAASPLFVWNNWGACDVSECRITCVVPFAYACVLGVGGHGLLFAVVTFVHWRLLGVARIVIRAHSDHSAHSESARARRTVVLTTACYALCWLPFSVCYVVIMASGTADGESQNTLLAVTHTIANVNYLINPFLYSWRTRAVREAIADTWRDTWLLVRAMVRKGETRGGHVGGREGRGQ